MHGKSDPVGRAGGGVQKKVTRYIKSVFPVGYMSRFIISLQPIPQIISVLIDFADYKSSRRLSGCPFFFTRAFLTQYLQIPRFPEGQNIYLAEKTGPKGGNMVAFLK